ncbi:MAG TPA: hypothetical protein VNZ52_15710 [Candidatus Thermoplasmatota archaeon]|nr:hypothetical protein [Candidatus Thermoplasmatota archaeon]
MSTHCATSFGLATLFLATALLAAAPTTEAGIPERCVTTYSGMDQTTTCVWTTECPISRHHSNLMTNWDEEYCVDPAGECAVIHHITYNGGSLSECLVPGPGLTRSMSADLATPCTVDYLIHSHGTDYKIACGAAGHELYYERSYTTITGDRYCERRALDGAYRADCGSSSDQ